MGKFVRRGWFEGFAAGAMGAMLLAMAVKLQQRDNACAAEEVATTTTKFASKISEILTSRAAEISQVADSPVTVDLMSQAALMMSLWVVPIGDYIHEATVLVGFAFAQGPLNAAGIPSPGGTNEGLAWSVASLIQEFAAAGKTRPKIMLQWEIAQVLFEKHGINADFVAKVDAEGNYLSTYGVMVSES